MRQESRKKRILYVITKATNGGAQRYVYDLLANLPQGTAEPMLAYGIEGQLVRDVKALHIETVQLPSLCRDVGIISDIRSFLEMKSLLRKWRPDVVHLNSSKAAGIGALAARLYGDGKIVFTVHGWPFKEPRAAITRFLIYCATWLTGLLSHTVVVVSEKDLGIGMRMPWVRKKIVYIIPARSVIAFDPPEAAFRNMFTSLTPPPITTNTLRLVSIAELTGNKGIRYAIEAVALLRDRDIDSIYAIAGEGEERGALETLARALGVQDRVFFLGYVPHAAQHLTGFDIYLLPSLKEGTPYALLEAGAAGLPVVATSVVDQSLVAMIPHMRFVPPRDARALADAAEALSRIPHAQHINTDAAFSDMIKSTYALYE